MILATSIVTTFVKYVLHSVEHGREQPWDEKSMYIFYLELVAGMFDCRLSLLYCFLLLVPIVYG